MISWVGSQPRNRNGYISTTVKGNLVKYWKIITVISVLVLVISIAAIYYFKNVQHITQEDRTPEPETAMATETVPDTGSEEIIVVDERERHCLALAIYHEARNQPLDGRIAVAAVVLNRVRTGAYPNSICAVIFDRCQFSWVCDRRKQYNPEFHANVIERRAWRDSVQLANDIIVNYNRRTFVDITQGATFFHAVYVRPHWRNHKTVTLRIGAHIFYRA